MAGSKNGEQVGAVAKKPRKAQPPRQTFIVYRGVEREGKPDVEVVAVTKNSADVLGYVTPGEPGYTEGNRYKKLAGKLA